MLMRSLEMLFTFLCLQGKKGSSAKLKLIRPPQMTMTHQKHGLFLSSSSLAESNKQQAHRRWQCVPCPMVVARGKIECMLVEAKIVVCSQSGHRRGGSCRDDHAGHEDVLVRDERGELMVTSALVLCSSTCIKTRRLVSCRPRCLDLPMPASMPRRRGSGSSGTARGQGAGCRERRRRWPSGRLPWLLLIRASRGRPGGGGVRRRPPPCTPPVPRSFARHLVRPIQPSEKALNIHGRPGDGWTRQRSLQGAPRRRRCWPEQRRRLDLQRPKQARIWSPLSSPISRSRCCPDCCGHPPSPERCASRSCIQCGCLPRVCMAAAILVSPH